MANHNALVKVVGVLAGVVMAGGTALGLTGCAPDAKEAPKSEPGVSATYDPSVQTAEPSVVLPAPTESVPTETEQAPAQTAYEYAKSQERNEQIGIEANALGEKIVKLAESGEVGYFDFYNFDKDEWGRGKGNAGNGALQHNPQYKGSDTQVIVEIKQNEDGSFDLGTIDGVYIATDEQTVEIAKITGTWEVQIISADPKTGEKDFNNRVNTSGAAQEDKSVYEVKKIETRAINQFSELLKAAKYND